MQKLTIVALGPSERYLTCAAREAICSAKRLILQTEKTAAAAWIKTAGLAFTSMDKLYERSETFDELNKAIARELFLDDADTVFAVAGTGIGGSALYRRIMSAAAEKGATVGAIAGIGYAQAAAAETGLFVDAGFRAVSAAQLDEITIDVKAPFAVEEIDSVLLAGEVKLRLMEYYPQELPVRVARLENGQYTARIIPLCELDRLSGYDVSTCVLLPKLELEQLERHGLEQVVEIIARLRAPGGCPWDHEQTHESMKKNLIEECYEVLDAIDAGDDDALCEELGDVLLQVVFHARIAQDRSSFTIRDVATVLNQKLIYRHPHVFSNTEANTSGEVMRNWEMLKKKEKNLDTQTEVLRAVPNNLPALMRAQKVQKKAGDVGFDWDDPRDALKKVREEADELAEELERGGRIEEELGDLFFAVVNVARLCRAESEQTLTNATNKFINRFERLENEVLAQGKQVKGLSLNQLDKIWERIKHQI
jgi:tetrapyrrole methylase family protein/MazG family protein